MDDGLSELEVLYSIDGEYITDNTWDVAERVVNSSLLPKLDSGFDLPPQRKDFANHIPVVTRNLKALKDFMRTLKSSSNYGTKSAKLKSNFAVSLLTLCGEHISENIWTNQETNTNSHEIISLLCQIFVCDSIGDLLVGEKCYSDPEVPRLYKPVLTALRPKLLKDTWKHFPGAVACYYWLLFQVHRKYLGDYLGMIVPTALIMTDDFIPENAVTGIKCIAYIAEHSTKADLYCHAEVMYSAVKQSLVHKNPQVVKIAVPCLVNLLDKIERNYLKDECITEWCKYDETFENILEHLELWQKTDIREAYLENLPLFLENMPLSLVNWSSRLLELFSNYMEMGGHSSPIFLKYTVLSLKVYLQKVWPRIQHHCNRLLRMLFRFLIDVTDILHSPDDTKLSVCNVAIYNEALKEAEECLFIIGYCAPEQVKTTCSILLEKDLFSEDFHKVIQKIVTSL
ncbi:TELO2-interacting protein 2-like [Schistocerca piceifrons]|uniref:TELO2-interacting protein 2-like n=1 Tax=Schistocerca piceifrons TaxID=274613 RepID=UPI001F5E4ED5|nr:TELO2-interacting protein 2-like [Schistocerca piceifrons]